jgi:hypothetical protein
MPGIDELGATPEAGVRFRQQSYSVCGDGMKVIVCIEDLLVIEMIQTHLQRLLHPVIDGQHIHAIPHNSNISTHEQILVSFNSCCLIDIAGIDIFQCRRNNILQGYFIVIAAKPS